MIRPPSCRGRGAGEVARRGLEGRAHGLDAGDGTERKQIPMMSKSNDGGQAFPTPDDASNYRVEGMTLRDYFAAHALTGLWSGPDYEGTQGQAAKWCYDQADEMLKAREKSDE